MNNYFSPFDVPADFNYFGGPPGKDDNTIIKRVIDRNYRPAGELFLELARTTGLKISYSFTGTVLEQIQQEAPDVIDLYRQLFATGKMELISETYFHSLASFYDTTEFIRQVELQRENLHSIFGSYPQIFRNTEFSYRDDIGEIIRRLGFKAIYTEGWDPILDWRSPNYMYRNQPVELNPEQLQLLEPYSLRANSELKLLLKNYNRSDDVAFRFQLKDWDKYPVTPEKFAEWITAEPGYLVNLCMDYETIGEHHQVDSGIFEFYRELPKALAKKGIEFILPSEAVEIFSAEEPLSFPQIVSWADAERDLSAWTGNKMQQKSLEAIYKIIPEIGKKLDRIEDQREREKILATWGKLQTSDHYYYMSTKYWSDGDVHKYFSPYENPYQAYSNFLNILAEFRSELGR